MIEKPDTEALANELYTLYCEKVGGKAFNGDPLPTWAEFYSSSKSQKQALAWIAVASHAISRLRPTEVVDDFKLDQFFVEPKK